MRTTFLQFVAASCTVALLAVTAQAQQTLPAEPNQVAPPPVQVDPADPSTQGDDRADREEQYEARRVDPAARSQQAKSVQEFLVGKLMLANKAEIELSQMATEKAKHQELKQFAQMLIQDHQQLNQKLQQLQSGQQGAGARNDARTQQSGQRTTERTRSNTAGNQQADQNRRPELADESNRSADRQQSRTAGQGEDKVPPQLTQLVKQAAQNHLQMAKESLQKREGQDFDMGFLAMQIAAHTHMVAELKAMQDVGSQQFQQLVSQAEQSTSEHLDRAKQLAQKFEDDRETANNESQSNNAGTGSNQRNR